MFWDWQIAELACPAMMHPDDVLDVRFMQSGKALLTVCRNPAAYRGRLRAWESATGQLLAPSIRLSGFSPRTIDLVRSGCEAIVAGVLVESHIIDLTDLSFPPQSTLPADALVTFAELQSGLRIIGNGMGTANLSTKEWLDRWNAFRKRSLSP